VTGTFYGTTSSGGIHCAPNLGCGTVFALDSSGDEAVVYSFAGYGDGELPVAPLTNGLNGTLYGTTSAGGTHKAGTVFTVTTAGEESVLYSFGDSPDGSNPIAGLINAKGALYGATYGGGAYRKCDSGTDGCGTVFKIKL